MVTPKLRSPGRVAVLGLLLAGGLAATVSSSHAVYASGSPCDGSELGSGSAGNSVKISIDTNNGCNTAGTAGNPTTGYVQVSVPANGQYAYAVFATEDNIQGGSHPYNTGAYSLNFTNCTGGTAVPDPINGYQVTNPNNNQYPTPPADASGTTYYGSSSGTNAPFKFQANANSAVITCKYTLAVPGNPSLITDIASYTVDAFVFYQDNTHARTQSVDAPGACTTGCTFGGTQTPELGSGELFATGILPIFGLYLYRRRRGKVA